MNTKTRGLLSETRFLAKCSEYGITVSQPFGDNAPYDFIMDVNGQLLKVQCKTLMLYDEVYWLQATSVTFHKGKTSVRDYIGKVDLYYAYHPETGIEVLVDANKHPKSLKMRASPPLRNYAYNKLSDHQFEKFVENLGLFKIF